MSARDIHRNMPPNNQNASFSSDHITINVQQPNPSLDRPSGGTSSSTHSEDTTKRQINNAPLPSVPSVLREHSKFLINSGTVLGDFGMDEPSNKDLQVPIETSHITKSFNVPLNEEERERGFRLLPEPDPLYLGFIPRRRDKRRYLNAMALVGPPLGPGVASDWHLPVKLSHKFCVVLFYLTILGLFGGGAFGIWYLKTHGF